VSARTPSRVPEPRRGKPQAARPSSQPHRMFTRRRLCRRRIRFTVDSGSRALRCIRLLNRRTMQLPIPEVPIPGPSRRRRVRRRPVRLLWGLRPLTHRGRSRSTALHGSQPGTCRAATSKPRLRARVTGVLLRGRPAQASGRDHRLINLPRPKRGCSRRRWSSAWP
jgi:hypothetical protein